MRENLQIQIDSRFRWCGQSTMSMFRWMEDMYIMENVKGGWWVWSDLMGSVEVIIQFILHHSCILFTIFMYNSSLQDIISIIYDHKFIRSKMRWLHSCVLLRFLPLNSSDTLLGLRQVSRTFPCSHLTLSLALSFACLRWITVLASTLSGQKSALSSIPWCPSTVIIFL